MAEIKTPDDLLSEHDVYEKYGNLFAERELREARQAGQIEFFDLRKGPHYSTDQLAAYLSTKATRKCRNDLLNDNDHPDPRERQNGSLKLEDTGSQPKIVALT